MTMAENTLNSEYKKLELKISDTLFQQIEQLFAENKWSMDEGLQLLLGAGYSFFTTKSEDESDKSENRSRYLIQRLMAAESELASLRFRVYELSESNRNWNLTQGAVEKENIALKNLINQLRQKNDASQEE